jgi:hypothetical protein
MIPPFCLSAACGFYYSSGVTASPTLGMARGRPAQPQAAREILQDFAGGAGRAWAARRCPESSPRLRAPPTTSPPTPSGAWSGSGSAADIDRRHSVQAVLYHPWVMRARRRWQWPLLAFVVLTAATTLLMGWLLDLERGTIGEWLSGVGTLAAVVVALMISHHEHRRAQWVEAVQRHRLEREEAARVNVWFENPNPGATWWKFVVDNGGRDAIYEWEAAIWWLRTGPPGPGPHNETYVLSASSDGPLPPGRKLERDLVPNTWMRLPNEALFPKDPAREFRVSIMWRDAADRWWLRYGGDLRGPEAHRWPLPWTVVPDGETDIDALSYRAIDPPPVSAA